MTPKKLRKLMKSSGVCRFDSTGRQIPVDGLTVVFRYPNHDGTERIEFGYTEHGLRVLADECLRHGFTEEGAMLREMAVKLPDVEMTPI